MRACRLLLSAASSCTTFPAWISRSLPSDAGEDSWARMCCLSASAVVESGCEIGRMMSGLEVEKRTTMSKGAPLAIVSAEGSSLAVGSG